MADDQEHAPHRRTTHQAEAEVEQQAETPPPQPEYVDPYKQVISPYELPANTAAASAIVATGNVAVDPDAPISDERKAQAEAAIQEHQDNVQEVVADISDDPRLEGGSSDFHEHAAKQAEAKAKREEEKAAKAAEKANA
jgi:hypothetical protein